MTKPCLQYYVRGREKHTPPYTFTYEELLQCLELLPLSDQITGGINFLLSLIFIVYTSTL